MTADPLIPSIRELEEHALEAWPALETIRFGGWDFRFAGGYTKRANSATALNPDLPFDVVRGEALRSYGERGLPTIFRIGPLAGAGPDAALGALGYRVTGPSTVLIRPLAADLSADGAVRMAPSPDSVWLDDHDPGRPADRALNEQIVAATRLPAAYATLVEDGGTIAFGRVVAGRGLAGLFSIRTVPQARGRGAGRRIVETLLAWARARGVTAAYLQVETDNAPALGLYSRFGFTKAYGYHYRVP